MKAEILYKGEVISTLSTGQTMVIHHNDQKFKSDFVIRAVAEVKKLSAPTISIDGSVVTITDTSGLAQKYHIHINGGMAEVTETVVDISTFTGLADEAGTYPVTVTALADGYEESDHSNSVDYVVEEKTYTLSGTWLFNSSLTSYSGEDGTGIYQYVPNGFTSNGTTYYRFSTALCVFVGTDYDYLEYRNADGSTVLIACKSTTGWDRPAERTVYFNGNCEVDKEFYDWFTANARQITDLTGLKVTVQSGWTATAGYGIFNITYTRNSVTYKSFGIGKLNTNSLANRVSFYTSSDGAGGSNSQYISSNSVLILYITGGTDAADTDLIKWFTDNKAHFIETA